MLLSCNQDSPCCNNGNSNIYTQSYQSFTYCDNYELITQGSETNLDIYTLVITNTFPKEMQSKMCQKCHDYFK